MLTAWEYQWMQLEKHKSTVLVLAACTPGTFFDHDHKVRYASRPFSPAVHPCRASLCTNFLFFCFALLIFAALLSCEHLNSMQRRRLMMLARAIRPVGLTQAYKSSGGVRLRTTLRSRRTAKHCYSAVAQSE